MPPSFKIVVISAIALLFGCIQENSPTAGQSGKSRLPDVKATEKAGPEGNLLAEGAVLFAKLCTSCHRTAGNGHGSKSGQSLQRPELTYGRTSAAIITQSIRDGRPGGSPAFGHVFITRKLEALTTYILSLKK